MHIIKELKALKKLDFKEMVQLICLSGVFCLIALFFIIIIMLGAKGVFEV